MPPKPTSDPPPPGGFRCRHCGHVVTGSLKPDCPACGKPAAWDVVDAEPPELPSDVEPFPGCVHCRHWAAPAGYDATNPDGPNVGDCTSPEAADDPARLRKTPAVYSCDLFRHFSRGPDPEVRGCDGPGPAGARCDLCRFWEAYPKTDPNLAGLGYCSAPGLADDSTADWSCESFEPLNTPPPEPPSSAQASSKKLSPRAVYDGIREANANRRDQGRSSKKGCGGQKPDLCPPAADPAENLPSGAGETNPPATPVQKPPSGPAPSTPDQGTSDQGAGVQYSEPADLISCPFCGAPASRLRYNIPRRKRGSRPAIECKGCGAVGPRAPADSLTGAHAAWNTRRRLRSAPSASDSPPRWLGPLVRLVSEAYQAEAGAVEPGWPGDGLLGDLAAVLGCPRSELPYRIAGELGTLSGEVARLRRLLDREREGMVDVLGKIDAALLAAKQDLEP